MNFKFILIPWLLFLNACGHLYMPVNRLETPENFGPNQTTRIELLGNLQGHNLSAEPLVDASSTTKTEYVSDLYYLQPFAGLMFKIDDNWAVGTRIMPHSPLVLKAQRQFYGCSNEANQKGCFSLSAVPTFGLSFGGKTNQATQFGLSLVSGYRLSRSHIITLTPFFDNYSLSGSSLSGSASQFGAGLGHEWKLEQSFIRSEITLTSGSFGSITLSGLYFGLLFGLMY